MREMQPYPPVDVTIFQQSVAAIQKVAVEAESLLRKLAEPRFAAELMNAAQAGNQKEVDRLIKSIGLRIPVTAQYTPSGIRLTMEAQAQDTPCCTLTLSLKWGE